MVCVYLHCMKGVTFFACLKTCCKSATFFLRLPVFLLSISWTNWNLNPEYRSDQIIIKLFWLSIHRNSNMSVSRQYHVVEIVSCANCPHHCTQLNIDQVWLILLRVWVRVSYSSPSWDQYRFTHRHWSGRLLTYANFGGKLRPLPVSKSTLVYVLDHCRFTYRQWSRSPTRARNSISNWSVQDALGRWIHHFLLKLWLLNEHHIYDGDTEDENHVKKLWF